MRKQPYRSLFLFFIYLLCHSFLRAQNTNIEFIENKGQWNNRIKYLGEASAGTFYVEQNGFTVVQHNPSDWAKAIDLIHNHKSVNSEKIKDAITIHSHAYKVEFLNAGQNPKMIADKPLPGYNNYFIGNDPSKWASDCKIYQGITMINVYPNVDVRYYSNNGAVKYDLIIKPGADISKIALKYHGLINWKLKTKN